MGLAIDYYEKLFAFDFQSVSISTEPRFWLIFMMAIFFSFFLLLPYGKKIHDAIFEKNYNNRMMTGMWFVSMILFLLSVSSLATADFNPFIYFRF